jgi:hypothetical protein
VTPRLHDALFAIEIDEIDREPHPERVHRFTWHDPQPLSAGKVIPAKQSFAAIATVTRQLRAIRELSLPGKIQHFDMDVRCFRSPRP